MIKNFQPQIPLKIHHKIFLPFLRDHLSLTLDKNEQNRDKVVVIILLWLNLEIDRQIE